MQSSGHVGINLYNVDTLTWRIPNNWIDRPFAVLRLDSGPFTADIAAWDVQVLRQFAEVCLEAADELEHEQVDGVERRAPVVAGML